METAMSAAEQHEEAVQSEEPKPKRAKAKKPKVVKRAARGKVGHRPDFKTRKALVLWCHPALVAGLKAAAKKAETSVAGLIRELALKALSPADRAKAAKHV